MSQSKFARNSGNGVRDKSDRSRPKKSKQNYESKDVLQETMDLFSEHIDHSQDDLVKLQKKYMLDVKYYSVTKGDDHYGNIDDDIQEMYVIFSKQRCHNSRLTKVVDVQKLLGHFVTTGTLPQLDKFNRTGELTNAPPDGKIAIRHMLMKIFIKRHPTTHMTAAFKMYFEQLPKAQGLYQMWQNRREYLVIAKDYIKNKLDSIVSSSYVQELTNKVKLLKESIEAKLAQILSGIGNATMAEVWKVAASIVVVVIVVGLLGSTMHQLIIPVLRKVIFGVPISDSLQSQAGDDDDDSIEEDDPLDFDFERTVKRMLKSVGAFIWEHSETKKTYDEKGFLERFSSHARNCTTIIQFLEKMWGFLKDAFEWVYMQVTGKPFFDATKVRQIVMDEVDNVHKQSQMYFMNNNVMTEDISNSVCSSISKLKGYLSKGLSRSHPGLTQTINAMQINYAELIESFGMKIFYKS